MDTLILGGGGDSKGKPASEEVSARYISKLAATVGDVYVKP